MRLNISVIGGSRAEPKYLKMAYEAGKLLAERDVTLICGGLGGVMEEVARGARDGGGICIGILPGISAEEGNRYLTAAIPTGIGFARNFLVVRAADALLAIDGSNGTMSEASFAIAEGKTVVSIDGPALKKEKSSEGILIEKKNVEEAVDTVIEEAIKWRRKKHMVWEE